MTYSTPRRNRAKERLRLSQSQFMSRLSYEQRRAYWMGVSRKDLSDEDKVWEGFSRYWHSFRDRVRAEVEAAEKQLDEGLEEISQRLRTLTLDQLDQIVDGLKDEQGDNSILLIADMAREYVMTKEIDEALKSIEQILEIGRFKSRRFNIRDHESK